MHTSFMISLLIFLCESSKRAAVHEKERSRDSEEDDSELFSSMATCLYGELNHFTHKQIDKLEQLLEVGVFYPSEDSIKKAKEELAQEGHPLLKDRAQILLTLLLRVRQLGWNVRKMYAPYFDEKPIAAQKLSPPFKKVKRRRDRTPRRPSRPLPCEFPTEEECRVHQPEMPAEIPSLTPIQTATMTEAGDPLPYGEYDMLIHSLSEF